MNYKKEIDEILNAAPDYLKRLEIRILNEADNNESAFLSFCLEYLPYSISEELILYARKTVLDLSKEDWISLIQNMSFNPKYGKETLSKFFQFHTAMTDEELNELGLNTINISKEMEDAHEYSLLKKDNPKVMRLYKSMRLDDNDIEQLHNFKNIDSKINK